MGWRLLGTIAAGLVGSLPAGCGVGEFTCSDDAQCVGQAMGVCQPDGYCSFPAADCPSGQRYGEHSGPRSGQCVGEASETGSTGEATGGTRTTGPASEDTQPALDTGPVSTSPGETTTTTSTEPVTTEPVVTTGEEVTSSEPTTGEPVDPDLVLWLELDRAPLGEVPDSSSYMAGGVCEPPGCPEGVRGAVGGGAWFDGNDDVVTVPHAPWLETNEGFTVAAFLRLDAVPTDFRSVLAKPFGGATSNSWEIYFFYEVLHVGMSGSFGAYWEVTSPWTFPPDDWVHVASTWDGAVLTLWLDGEAVGSVEVPEILLDDQAIRVGADDDHLPQGLIGHFPGGLDDVRVYRRPLAAEELAALAGGF